MPFGTVEKVKKIGNYSFVHYAERDQALAGIRFETFVLNSFKIFFGRIPIFENPTKFNLTMIFLNL